MPPLRRKQEKDEICDRRHIVVLSSALQLQFMVTTEAGVFALAMGFPRAVLVALSPVRSGPEVDSLLQCDYGRCTEKTVISDGVVGIIPGGARCSVPV